MSIESILSLPGPQFLVFYLFVFLICWLGSLVWRNVTRGESGTTIALLIFELIGTAKLSYALSHGKHNVLILVLMMIFGGIVMFIKNISGNGLGGGGSCSTSYSSCSSSCGGGGCGGGGCGGCGG